MQQYDRVAFAGDQIVQPHSVDVGEAALRGLRRFGSARFHVRWHERVYSASRGNNNVLNKRPLTEGGPLSPERLIFHRASHVSECNHTRCVEWQYNSET